MSKLQKQLASPGFIALEDQIAQQAGVVVDRSEMKAYAEFAQEALDQSGLGFDTMKQFCEENKAVVGELAKRLLKKFKSPSFVAGSTILFAIYIYYLDTKTDKQLLAFLKQRSIPRVEIFLKTLKDIHAKVKK